MRLELLILLTTLTSLLTAAPSKVPKHPWLASAGLGFTVSPGGFLLNPQFEYVYRPDLNLGAMAQLGFGDSTLFTFSLEGRYFFLNLFENMPKLKPSVEGGVGLATLTNAKPGDSSFGVLIHAGVGVDYQLEPNIFIGSMLRINSAPPVKTLFISWAVLMGRLLL